MTETAEKKTYRRRVEPRDMVSFQVRVKETDLLIHADKPLDKPAKEAVLRSRGYLEAYIGLNPEFEKTHSPWEMDGPVPPIVREMIQAGRASGVGPMAAVAGAISEQVGRQLLEVSDRVVVENGGDVFLQTDQPVVVGIYAGTSPLSMRIGLRVHPGGRPMAVCTSSGTVGHSRSYGRADAVCVTGANCALADAAATAIGNRVAAKADIQKGIEFGKQITGLEGVVIIVEDQIGLWGRLELVPLDRKNA